METSICIAIGFISGILNGLLGIGGASVLIPFMVIFIKMTQQQAQGTSLAIICLSFFSMLIYFKKGYVNFSIAALIGIGFIFGGFIGAHIADLLPEQILKKFFAILLLITAVKIFISK
jgi:uncharacterized membrane protein YfcA